MMKGNTWKFTKIGIGSAVVLVSAVFAIPLKSVPYQIIETYYATETKQESYVDREPYVVEELREKSETIFDGHRYMVPSGVVIPLKIDKPDVQLVASIKNDIPVAFQIYSLPSGHIIYEKLGITDKTLTISLSEGNHKAVFRESVVWGKEIYLCLVTEWTELEEITKYKDVTKYREVPVQIEKQRTVTQYEKKSIWQLIFSD